MTADTCKSPLNVYITITKMTVPFSVILNIFLFPNLCLEHPPPYNSNPAKTFIILFIVLSSVPTTMFEVVDTHVCVLNRRMKA